jgi:membrane protein implicated in regulation of membrane protease activity
MEWLWWLGGAIALGLIEILTLDLTFLMLASGALAGSLAAGLGAPGWVCAVVFSAVSVLMLAAVRPWALGHLKSRGAADTVTGAAATVGREGVALTEVTRLGGRAKIAGEVWTARTPEDGQPIAEASPVTVLEIDGATAVVAPQTA